MKYALTLLAVFLIGMNYSEAKPIKVAIIDTGFSPLPFDDTGRKLCETGHFDFNLKSRTVGEDTYNHGSYVTSLVNQHAGDKEVCFMIYKIFGPGVENEDVETAFKMAYLHGAKVINFSVELYYHSTSLKRTLNTIARRGTKIFVAAGNSKKNLNGMCNVYPTCFVGVHRNMIRVGALDEDGDVAKYSNYGARLSVYKFGRLANGSRGTSFAAPRAAGDYIRESR